MAHCHRLVGRLTSVDECEDCLICGGMWAEVLHRNNILLAVDTPVKLVCGHGWSQQGTFLLRAALFHHGASRRNNCKNV